MGWARLSQSVLRSAKRLKFISWLNIGCDALDLQLMKKQKMQLANVRGAYDSVVAEQAMALMLGLAKHIRTNDDFVREGRWFGWWDPATVSRELQGATVCVLGYGSIGKSVGLLCRAFDMKVLAVNRSGRGDPSDDGITIGDTGDLDEFLRRADYVVLALPLIMPPLDKPTEGIIDGEKLNLMKASSFLINVSHARLIDEAALARSLESGHLAGFASSAWWEYGDAMPPDYHFPVPSRFGIHKLSNVLACPEPWQNVIATRGRMIKVGLDNLRAFLRGMPVPNLVSLSRGY
jgi:lactate dehydrogenase-like 2-hydroxyacid dehydrogenase